MPKTYKLGNDFFDIPDNESGSFLKDNPNAIETNSYTVGKDTFDVPVTEVDFFLKDNPGATPLKKKLDTQSNLGAGLSESKQTKNDLDFNGRFTGGIKYDPELKKHENALVSQNKKIDQLEATTRDQFLNNPVFSDSNPNAQKNKDIYLKQLGLKGYNTAELKEFSKRLDRDKVRYAENITKVSQNPNDLESSYNAASAATTLGEYGKAIELYQNVLSKLNPERTDTGQGMVVTGGDDDINTITTKSPYRNPSASLYGIGYAMLGTKDYKQAADYFNQAIKVDPSNANAKAGLARAQYFLGDKKGAQQTYKEATEQKVKNESDPSLAPAKQLQQNQQEDIEQQRESDEIKGVADAWEAFAVGDPEGKLGNLGFLNPVGKYISGVQAGTMTIAKGVKEFAKASENGNLDELKSSILTIGLGGAETVFASIPAVTAFNTGIAAIKETAKTLPKDLEEAVNTTVDFPFQSVSMMAKALGYSPEDESDAGKMLHMADIIASFGTMKAIHLGSEKIAEKLSEPGRAINDLKEISQKVAEGKATPEEIKAVKDFSEYAKTLKLADIKKAAEKINTPEAKQLVIDFETAQKENPSNPKEVELQDKLTKLESDQEKLADTDKALLQPQIDKIREEIDMQINEELKDAENTATNSVRVSDITFKIEELESKKETLSNEGKKVINEQIEQLYKERDSLKPEDNSLSIEDLEEFEILSFAKESGTATKADLARLKELEGKQNAVTRSDIKESAGQQVFGKPEVKKAIQKAEGQSIVEPFKLETSSPGREKYVADKIEELKSDVEADFGEGLIDVYKSKFASEFDKKNNLPSKENTHRLVQKYNELSHKDKKSAYGQGLFGKIREANESLGFQLKPRNKGRFTLVDEKGKEVKRIGTPRSKDVISEEKRLKERRHRARTSEPMNIEEAVAQDIANGVKFDHEELKKVTGLTDADIPFGLTRKDGKGVKVEFYKNRIAEKGGKTDEEYNDAHMTEISEVADVVASYMTKDGKRRALDYIDELQEKRENGGFTDKELNEYAESLNIKADEFEEMAHEITELSIEELEERIKEEKQSEKEYHENREKETGTSKGTNEIVDAEKGEGERGEKETRSEKAKKLADKIRKSGEFFDDKTTSAPPLLKAAWKGAHEVVATAIESGAEIADAIEKGIEYLKNTEYYKGRTAKGKELLEQQVRQSIEKDFIEPPAKPSEAKTNKSGSKKLKLGERILDSENVSSEIKAGLEKEGIDYIPIKLDVTQADAKAYVRAFEEVGEIDKAISNVTNMSNGMSGLNRGAIGKELFEVLADKAKEAKTEVEQKKWQDKAVEVARFTAENFKNAGQEINAAKEWKRMLERTPEGAIASLKRDYSDKNDAVLKNHDVKGAKEVIDEFIKSKEFEKIVGEKVKAELEKLNKKSPKSENIFNSKKARDNRKEELKRKWAEAKGSASSTLVGLNKEQIEVLGEMALIHIIDGAVKLEQLAVKLKKDFDSLTPEQVKEVWDTVDVDGKKVKEYAEEKIKGDFEESTIKKALEAFSGQAQSKIEMNAFKDAVKEIADPKTQTARELRDKLFSDLEKKLGKINPESRKRIIGEAIQEIHDTGGLDQSRFMDMIAKELGLPTLDAKAESKIRSLIETINQAEKSGKELQQAFDTGADKSEIKAKQKKWIDDVFKGQKANSELSQYFKDEKRLGTTFSTLLQGNLLGTLSVAKNIYSNTLIQPLRALSRGISSVADYSMSKAAKLPVLNKFISEGRTIDALAYWKGESRGVLPGLRTSFRELLKGINPEEMIERDLTQQLQPLKSAVSFYEGLTGEKKQTAYQQINNFAEATFGIPAETMFRLLNLGDKPFRKSAEYGAAYEIGKLKGLKGKELDKFVLFPDAKSAEEIKLRAERSVYQQSEGLAKVAQDGIRSIENYLSDIPYVGDVARVVFKSQIPYVKTPLNIIGETIEYAIPEYASAKGVYHALKGDRRQALEYMGKAVTGFAIRYAAGQLVQNNLVTPNADYKDSEGTAIQLQNVPPSSLNITGLQRMLSGGSSAIKDNDVWVNYNNMGVVGMMIALHANQKGIKPEEKSYLQELATETAYLSKSSLEQSFLQGVNTFLEAVTGDDRSKRKWAINTLGALGSVFYPNTIANVSKASDPNIRVTKADSFSDELINTFKVKMFSGDGLPTKVNLWGESVKSAPEGRNKYIWYLLDVTKAKSVDTDSFNYKMYELWEQGVDEKQKREILPNIPRQTIVVRKNHHIKLSSQYYEEYQQLTGKNRANLVEKYTKSPNWLKDDIETKIDKLKKIYKTGGETAKRQILLAHPELKKQ